MPKEQGEKEKDGRGKARTEKMGGSKRESDRELRDNGVEEEERGGSGRNE